MKKFICIFLAICLSFCLAACDININIVNEEEADTSTKKVSSKKTSSQKDDSSLDDISSDFINSENNDGKNKYQEILNRGELVVGTTFYEPYGYIDENDGLVGVEVDILTAIAKKIGVKIIFKECNFDQIMTNLIEGDVDLVATALARTEARTKIANASIDVYPCFADNDAFFAVFYTAKDNPQLTQAIDDAILELQLDGTVDRILEKYNAAP